MTDMPTGWPSEVIIDDSDTDTCRVEPSVRRLTERTASARSPRFASRNSSANSRRCSGSTRSLASVPMALAESRPKSTVAAAFQVLIRPSRSVEKIASRDDSTMAARRAAISWLRRVSVVS
jgi:hypothetical protein